MKIAVSSYSFSQYLKDGRMTQLDCIARAKELGFDAIEFTDLLPPEGETPLDYAKALREECERLSVVSVTRIDQKAADGRTRA